MRRFCSSDFPLRRRPATPCAIDCRPALQLPVARAGPTSLPSSRCLRCLHRAHRLAVPRRARVWGHRRWLPRDRRRRGLSPSALPLAQPDLLPFLLSPARTIAGGKEGTQAACPARTHKLGNIPCLCIRCMRFLVGYLFSLAIVLAML